MPCLAVFHPPASYLPRLCGLVLVCLFLLAAASCSSKDNRKPVYPVKGRVLFQDKPAAGAFVVFVPVNESAEPTDPRPGGYADKDGFFTLSTYGANDGAPAGEYYVSVVWRGTNPDETRDDDPDRLQGRYSDPKKSGLRATVREGPNELAPFRLK
ncbi:MAG TPA: hypothetical protein VNK04_03785 [Gemmataceae bacterium]|nr:hypothetical protein [Gemmataceae bacterium]